uniref:Uncharacterized protein n=1 Tax=Chlorobium chlorochromatii (strain CaD3) TaxID=340177 RepID=Q3AT02_CHLCH
MVITLTPEFEQALHKIAEHNGTTVELLVLKTLQENLLFCKPQKTLFRKSEKTLADFLVGYVGVFDSDELVKSGAQMSTNVRKQFGDILLEKRQQQKL